MWIMKCRDTMHLIIIFIKTCMQSIIIYIYRLHSNPTYFQHYQKVAIYSIPRNVLVALETRCKVLVSHFLLQYMTTCQNQHSQLMIEKREINNTITISMEGIVIEKSNLYCSAPVQTCNKLIILTSPNYVRACPL